MNKILPMLLSGMLFSSAAIAQDHRQDMSRSIAENHVWLYAYSFDKAITLNLSESMWQLALSADKIPNGIKTVKRMGEAFVNISDHFGGTELEQSCGFTANNELQRVNHNSCQQAIDGWNGKYALTVNAAVPGNPKTYELVFGYISSVAIYLSSGSSALWEHGYTPKSTTQHIIINADNKYKGMSVSWSGDFSTVTINAPASVEAEDWDAKIEKGLEAGWKH